MPIPIPHFRPPPLPEPTPVVRVVAREEVEWNRPIFKAPPLEVYQKMFAPAEGVAPLGPLPEANR